MDYWVKAWGDHSVSMYILFLNECSCISTFCCKIIPCDVKHSYYSCEILVLRKCSFLNYLMLRFWIWLYVKLSTKWHGVASTPAEIISILGVAFLVLCLNSVGPLLWQTAFRLIDCSVYKWFLWKDVRLLCLSVIIFEKKAFILK